MADGRLSPIGGHNPEPSTEDYPADFYDALAEDCSAEADLAACCCGC
jgi:hypothetical protein